MSARHYVTGLAQLHRLETTEERHGVWRQSMATLAAMAADQEPVPLEGLHPESLLQSVRVALQTGLVDDLSWLSPAAASIAVFELASALPASAEKRELGRRVLRTLHEGDAATFVALATALALGSRRGLSGAPIRARVALSLDLPIGTGTGTRVDALALALVSRRELEREWLTVPSTGSLPSRRLAARLLERAAREAARRASDGDDSGLRVFEMPAVRSAWDRLLGDRESLVWRHVATARGLLSGAMPAFADEIERNLEPSLSPTEWRRAAASLAARIAIDPIAALRRAREILIGPILKSDPGVAGTMIFGLPRAAEAEPTAAEELLGALVRAGGIEAAEALVELMRERVAGDFGARAVAIARESLKQAAKAPAVDDGRAALVDSLGVELATHDGTTLRDLLASALVAFAEKGARHALAAAEEVVALAQERMAALEAADESDSAGRRTAFRVLRELDVGLLETAAISDLLTIGARNDFERATAPLADVHERLTDWILAREFEPVRVGAPLHPMMGLRRLRTLLHLVDADGPYGLDGAARLRDRRSRCVRVLLIRAKQDAPSPSRRTLCAALARACDGLVREEVCELSDVLITATMDVRDENDVAVLGEATMVPELESVLATYLAVSRAAQTADRAPRSLTRARASVETLLQLAHALPPGSSARVEALRRALVRFARALESILSATSLQELSGSFETAPLGRLESAAQALAELTCGARRRLGRMGEEAPLASGASLRLVDFAVDRSLRGTPDAIDDALASAVDTMREELPSAVADVASIVLRRIPSLPANAPPRQVPAAPISLFQTRGLPLWLPPNRTIGNFYVLGTIGAGAGGSVFVVRRGDERHVESAERFALKVPEYDGAAARTLSESEFHQLFRDEAGALLALPQHPNLARFVTFDAGARPKPILVMELVEGPTLERLVERRELDMTTAILILDGVAAGLCAMHSAGVAHLDVKPSNIILRARPRAGREPDSGFVELDAASQPQPIAQRREPVLVDFGLAGRKVRPGCATANYGAPEVWGAFGAHVTELQPMPADVYAFACVAFEVLTGEELFDGPAETAMITAHLNHDGIPPPLAVLGHEPELRPLAELLSRALRRAPHERIPMVEMRAGLAALAPNLSRIGWPLSFAASAA